MDGIRRLNMQHNFDEVFDTNNELWQRVLDIFDKNEKYEKKVVSNRNLHHKFPKSFSKKLCEPVDNDKDNLISLSLADHFLIHYYYYKLAKKGYRQSMATAFTFMAKKSIKYMSPDTAEMIAKDYEEALPVAKSTNKGKKFGQRTDETRKNISNALKGRSLSEEHRNSLSKACKGRTPWNKGRSKYDFDELFVARYGVEQRANVKLYNRERKYYIRHGKCSWE